MTGRRRMLTSITVAATVTALGATGIVLAATAQGSEVAAASMPTFGYDFSTHNAYVGQTVTLTQTHLADDGTPVGEVIQKINWGDGTVQSAYGTTKRFSHTYRSTGSFAVVVTLTDDERVWPPRGVGRIGVQKDTAKPTVSVTKPANATRVASWPVVKGKASDTGSGVKTVALTAIEKRGSAWYYYNGSGWTKAASQTAAGQKAKVLTVTPLKGLYSFKIKGLTKGSVRFAYTAFDRAGNRSAPKYLTQTLSK